MYTSMENHQMMSTAQWIYPYQITFELHYNNESYFAVEVTYALWPEDLLCPHLSFWEYSVSVLLSLTFQEIQDLVGFKPPN